MADYPDHLRYTETHEWVQLDGDIATMGITSYALAQLSDLVDLEITCEPGDSLNPGDTIAEVESVKAASDIYLPVAGEVTEVHEGLGDEIDLVMEDPYGRGWIIKFKPADPASLGALMNVSAYVEQTADAEE